MASMTAKLRGGALSAIGAIPRTRLPVTLMTPLIHLGRAYNQWLVSSRVVVVVMEVMMGKAEGKK